eukprot:GFKZ01009718.1.p1 GENE.GFKZ01009718.1~~GFKZ01009718.1.p1  ORF type:complete len:342 (+),score=24.69 GFKZ01009718.1:210-1235(+)
MQPPAYSLTAALQTITVATDRVILSTFSSPTPTIIFDTFIALNPVVSAFWLSNFLILLQLVLSLVTRSYAWNDRLWPVIPFFLALTYTLHAPLSHDRRLPFHIDLRLSIMSFLIFLWATRLIFNAIRRGYYKPGFIDHRYPWLQTHVVPNRLLFLILYVLLVVSMTFLLALACSPLYLAWLWRGSPLNLIDFVASTFFLLSVLLETLADNQQYAFHTRKQKWHSLSADEREKRASAGDGWEERDGFAQTGLFAWSRHPNFFAEMAIWCSFYLFSVSASGFWINWTAAGALSYVALFQLTTPLTECISSGKYPAYRDYQRRVSRLWPSPFSRTALASRKKEE